MSPLGPFPFHLPPHRGRAFVLAATVAAIHLAACAEDAPSGNSPSFNSGVAGATSGGAAGRAGGSQPAEGGRGGAGASAGGSSGAFGGSGGSAASGGAAGVGAAPTGSGAGGANVAGSTSAGAAGGAGGSTVGGAAGSTPAGGTGGSASGASGASGAGTGGSGQNGGGQAGGAGAPGEPPAKVGTPVLLGVIGGSFPIAGQAGFILATKTHLGFNWANDKGVYSFYEASFADLQPVPVAVPFGVDLFAAEAQGDRFFLSTYSGPNEDGTIVSHAPGEAALKDHIVAPLAATSGQIFLSVSASRVCGVLGSRVHCQDRATGVVTEGPSSALERRELAHTSQAAYAIGTNKGTGNNVLTKWRFDGTTVTVAHPDVSTWVAAAGDTVWARSAGGNLLVSHEASPGFVELAAALPGGQPVNNTLAVRENDLFTFAAEGDELTLYRVTDAGAVSVARTGICKGARHLILSASSIVWICPGLAVMRAPLLP